MARCEPGGRQAVTAALPLCTCCRTTKGVPSGPRSRAHATMWSVALRLRRRRDRPLPVPSGFQINISDDVGKVACCRPQKRRAYRYRPGHAAGGRTRHGYAVGHVRRGTSADRHQAVGTACPGSPYPPAEDPSLTCAVPLLASSPSSSVATHPARHLCLSSAHAGPAAPLCTQLMRMAALYIIDVLRCLQVKRPVHGAGSAGVDD